MSELATLSAMAEAARFAAGLMPVNLAPGQFGTWDDFKAAFDLVDRPLTAAVRDRLAAARPGVPWADEIDAELPDGEAWVVDAVDGAIQYLQGLPQWSVSVALVRDGQPGARRAVQPVPWRALHRRPGPRGVPRRGAGVPVGQDRPRPRARRGPASRRSPRASRRRSPGRAGP